MYREYLPYSDQETLLEGCVVYQHKEKQPAVILCPTWSGRDSAICEKAEEIASWGYLVFVLDMYGKGVVGKSAEENKALKRPFEEDRALLQRRVLKAYEVVRSLPYVNTDFIATLGFGFGGMCALDLARSGVPIKGAISVYGHFKPPLAHLTYPIQAKIAIFHGYNDPVTPLTELHQFEKEMDESQIDWQLHLYGNTYHAFANPLANSPDQGLLYNPLATHRCLRTIQLFLKEDCFLFTSI